MNRVQDKVAIVTGGAVGIGRAACLALASEGAKVAVTDLQEENGRKVVEEIKEGRWNGGILAFGCLQRVGGEEGLREDP